MSEKTDFKSVILAKAKTQTSVSVDDFASLGLTKKRICGIFWILLQEKKLARVTRGTYKYVGTTETTTQSESSEFELTFGLEIETEYNRNALGFWKKAPYHNTNPALHVNFNKTWNIESDGSLYRQTFAAGDMCEIISIPFSYSQSMKVLSDFQKTVLLRARKQNSNITASELELNNLLSFNNSTGAHIHLGLIQHNKKKTTLKVRNKTVILDGKQIDIKKFISIDFLHKATKLIKSRVKKELPQFYDSFKRYYFRHRFAKRIVRDNYLHDRYTEFNYCTHFPTIEFRSPHLRGIKKWSEFFAFYKIVFESLKKTFDAEMKKTVSFNQIISRVIELETRDNSERTTELIVEGARANNQSNYELILDTLNNIRAAED